MLPSSLRRLSFFVAAILIGAAVYFTSRQPVPRRGPAEVLALVAWPAFKTAALTTPAPATDCCPAVVGEPQRVANPVARPAALLPAPVAGALDAFRTWAARYVAAPAEEKAALVPQGRALAEARRAAFGSLIRQDPRAALGALLPYELRKALPPEIADTIEHRLSGVGDLMVIGVRPLPGTTVDEPIYRTASLQGTEYRAYTYGKRLGDISRPQTPILGVGVTLADGSRLAAVRDEAYEVLGKAEATDLRAQLGAVQTICPVSAQPTESTGTETAVNTGRKVIWLCAGGHMEEWLQSPDGALVMAAGGSGNSGGTSPVNPATYTQGNKKFLAIRVRFADQAVGFEPATDATMQTEMQKVVDRLADWSYGKMEASFAFTPTLDLPGTQADYSTHGMSFLTSVARPLAAAYTDATGARPYNTANFDFDAVVFSTNVWGNYCGVAWVGTKGTMIKCASAGVFLHEWGHNFGLGHANFWQPTSDSPIGAGTHQEYGSKYSVMGAANLNAYNSFERMKITWLAPADVVTVNANAGTYRIYNADKTTLTATHPYGLRIYKDNLVYNVEYRPNWDPAATHFSTSNGALMLWSQGTELLDMNPLTAAGNDDAPLLVGRSFHDPAQGLTITPTAIGGTAPDNYMDLMVNITNTVANSAPVAVVTASNYAAATGVAVTLTATASDPDGDALAYAWDFGEGSVSASNVSVNNAAVQTKSWSTAGDYNVRCTVSDMKGKTSVQNVVVRVGTPATFTISGRVTRSDGTPVQDVLVQDTSSRLTYTDADGRYTLGKLAVGSYTISALRSGWTLAAQFANPVVIGPSAVNVDFTATAPVADGGITLEHWDGISGTLVSDLTGNPAYLNPPTYVTTLEGLFEASTNTGDNYGRRARGWFKPPTTGAYTFYIASDASSELWLSTNDQAASKVKIASVTGSTGSRVWTTYASQRSSAITLTAGQRYYIEALHKEGTGSDNLAVGVDFPGAVQHRPLETTYLDPITAVLPPTPANTVTIAATDAGASEAGPDTGTFTITRTGPTASALPVYFDVTGTAIYGSDFSATGVSATIPAGAASTTVTITPIDDTVSEADETVIVQLAPALAYTLGASAGATVVIQDNEPVQVSIVATDATAAETGGDTGTFTITRTGSTAGALTVGFSIGGNATNGTDYPTLTPSVTIPIGQSTATITIAPTADAAVEPEETIIFTVTAGAGYTVGTPSSATVRILEPAVVTWKTAVSGNWSDGSKWNPGSPDSIGHASFVLNFNPVGTYTSTNDLSAGFMLNQLNFGGSNATLAGNSLAFTANGAVLPLLNQNGGGTVAMSNNLTLSDTTTVGGIGAGAVTFSGVITGGGGLIKTSTGTLTLAGTGSTIGGATTVSAGILGINSGGTLSAGGATKINGGSSLNISGGSVLSDLQFYLGDTSDNNSVTVTGTGSKLIRGTGAGSGTHRLYLGMQSGGGNGGTGNSLLISAGGYVYSGGGNSDRSILNSTNNTVTVTGPGSRWHVSANNLYIGTNTGSTNNSIVVTNGGALTMGSSQFVNIGAQTGCTGNSIAVTGAGSSWATANSQIALGSGGTTTGSGGTAAATGNSLNVANGGVISDLNWLMVGNSTTAANNNSVLVQGGADGGGLLEINSGIVAGGASATGNTVTTQTGGILQFKTATPTITITAGNSIAMNGGTLAYKSVNSTSTNLLNGNAGATGAGLLIWSGSNTFRLDSTTETGGGNYTLANNLGAKNYTGLELYGTTGIARAITLDGTHGGTLLLNGATSNVSGGITLNGSVSVTASGPVSTLTGVLSGSGSLVKWGAGTLTLKSANTYIGNTVINAGTLAVQNGAALADATAVTVSAGAMLNLLNNETVGSLAGAGSVILGGNTLTVGDNGGSTEFSGVISGPDGGLSKTGGGSLTLTGANTYTGATAINFGTLAVNGSIAAGGTVTVASGATLSGAGTIAATTTVNGNQAPGTSVGAQTFTGALTYGAAGRMQWELAGNTGAGAGTSFDKVTAAAVTVTNGAAIDLLLNSAGSAVNFADPFWAAAQSWTVLTGTSVSGTLALGTATNDPAGRVASNYGTFAVQQTATAVNLTWTPFAPIAVWRNLQFGANAGNAAISGDFVDVEKDGLVNLMEYALGLNPNVFNTSGRPSGVVEGAYLTMTYTRAKAATDITLRAVWSTALGGWSTTGITEDILLDDGTVQTVKAKVLTAPDTKKFLRLEATRP